MKTLRLGAVLALVGCVALTGCATTSPADSTAEELGKTFGSCVAGGESWFDAVDVMANVDEWFEVDQMQGDRDARDETKPVTITDSSGRVAHAKMFGATWPGIDWGLKNDADVWIATATTPADLVTLAMVITPRGEVFFAGDCADEMRIGLADHLGDRTSELLAQVPTTPQEDVYALLDYPDPASPTPPTPEVVVLNDESTDPSVLAGLRGVELTITISDVVGNGQFTICTEIPAGWNDCIVADDDAAQGTNLPVWVDGSGTLVFWLLNADGDTAQPLGRLGEATADGNDLSVLIDTSEISDDGHFSGTGLVAQG